MRAVKAVLICAVAWMVLTAAPYLIVGEYWGMVWYLVNLPLAEFLKGLLWPINIPLYVVVVTLGNGVLLGALLNLFITTIKKRRKN